MTGTATDSYAVLRIPNFRRFLIGTSGVFMATQIQSTVLGLQVYEITRASSGVGEAAWQVGLIGLSEAVPFLALTLFGGWASDRWDRRWLAFLGLAGLLSGAVVLALINRHPVQAVWPFLVVQALGGAARALYRPASVALGTELIPKALYGNAAAWRTNLFQVATVSGPAIGTLLYGAFGPMWTYTIMSAGFGVGLIALLTLSERPPREVSRAPMGQSLMEGVRFVWTENVVLAALSLDLFAVLFGGAVAMIPAFVLDVLHADPAYVGWMRAAPAVGALLMGLWIARHGAFKRAGIVLLAAVAAFGVTWIFFALSTNLWLSMALLAVGGGLDSISMVLRSTMIQTYTPQALMGRVSAVNSFFIGSSNELGAFESGAAARLIGLVPSVVVGGCLTIATVGLTAWRAPALRKLDRVV